MEGLENLKVLSSLTDEELIEWTRQYSSYDKDVLIDFYRDSIKLHDDSFRVIIYGRYLSIFLNRDYLLNAVKRAIILDKVKDVLIITNHLDENDFIVKDSSIAQYLVNTGQLTNSAVSLIDFPAYYKANLLFIRYLVCRKKIIQMPSNVNIAIVIKNT